MRVLRGAAPSGSGYGSGDGYGAGYGYGSGSGSGSGYGSGDGYGDGYWLAVARQQPEASAALACGATVAYWKSDSHGRPSNGSSGTVAAVGLVEHLPGPIRDDCGKGQLHATGDPTKWEGSRLWLVALHGEVRHDESDRKMWALKREILAELPWMP